MHMHTHTHMCTQHTNMYKERKKKLKDSKDFVIVVITCNPSI